MTNRLPKAIRTAVHALLIALVSWCWTVFIPGCIASYRGVFYKDNLKPKVPPDVREAVLQYEIQQTNDETTIRLLNSLIASAVRKSTNFVELQILATTRRELLSSTSKAGPPYTLIGFYLNPQMLLWPTIYTALGVFAVIRRPPLPEHFFNRRRCTQISISALVIYVCYEWPLWLRNFLFNRIGRKVYAYPNVDIDWWSFIMQELVVLGFASLIAIVVYQWAIYYDEERTCAPQSATENTINQTLDPIVLEKLYSLFVSWQINSIILAIGFYFFIDVFWNLVVVNHDQRYLISAIIAHLLWALCWILISLPLVFHWQKWESNRERALLLLLQAEKVEKDRTDLINNIHPFGSLIGPVSAAAAVISFLLPILKSLIS